MPKATSQPALILPAGIRFVQFLVKSKTVPYKTDNEYHIALVTSDSLRTACGTTINRSRAKEVPMQTWKEEPAMPCCGACLRRQNDFKFGKLSTKSVPKGEGKKPVDDYFEEEFGGLFSKPGSKPKPKPVKQSPSKLFS